MPASSVYRACDSLSGSLILRRGALFAWAAALVGLASALLVATPAAAAGSRPATSEKLIRASRTFRGDVRALPRTPGPPARQRTEREPPRTPLQPGGRSAPIGAGALPGLQPLAPAPLSSFEGLHYGEDCGGVQCGDGHPPDTNGDVGPAYFVQTVNTAVGIYDKSTGARVAGFSLNALMS